MDTTRLGKAEDLRGRLRKIAETYGWCLCVGAGTSLGVFGDWQKLAKALLKRVRCSPELIRTLADSYSSEALIQTAFNILVAGKPSTSDKEFVDLLSKELYGPFKNACGAEWDAAAKALSTLDPRQLSREKWTAFRKLIEQHGPPSALPLAETTANILATTVGLSSIISFNAEPLLFALINCCYKLQAIKKGHDERPLDRVVHDISQRHRARVPFFYIHGLLPVPNGKTSFNRGLSTDKLVFSEGHYLQISKSAYTWQSATFLSQCTQHRLVFFGLSFSDPNLRRWLAWDHAGRTDERRAHGYPEDRLQHYWIRKIPDNDSTVARNILQRSVAHLGVRIVWIDSWDKIGAMLNHMLAQD